MKPLSDYFIETGGLGDTQKSFQLYRVLLIRVYIAVKRYHDYGNSYKGKRLIGGGLQIQRFNTLLS